MEALGRGEIGAGFWLGNVKKRDDLEDLGIERKTILKWILKMRMEDMDWINVARDRDKWLVVMNVVMNRQV